MRRVLERAQGGENIESERIDSPPDDAKRWVHGRVAPDFDAKGELRGLYCTEYDIHDLKMTEQALARARSSSACSPTIFRTRSSIWTPSAATRSSTRRSST